MRRLYTYNFFFYPSNKVEHPETFRSDIIRMIVNEQSLPDFLFHVKVRAFTDRAAYSKADRIIRSLNSAADVAYTYILA